MRLADLAAALPVRLIGDGDVDVLAVRTVFDAGPTDVAFVAHARERAAARTCRAAAILVDAGFAADHADALPCAVLAADEPGEALGRALAVLHPRPAPVPGVHPTAVVDASARLGADVVIGAHVVIEADVVVGDRCVLGPHVVLRRGVRLGAGVVVGPGSVIGDDGFVTVAVGPQNRVVPHAGGVVVGDDVDIGAHVCIDRGLLSDTRVGDGCRLDNLVQVAHDVVLGRDVVVVAQVGIAGFARIGDGAVLAGQAGVNPHVRIAPRVRVGGQAGVTNDVDTAGAAVAGTPAIPHLTWLRAMASLATLPALTRRVRALEPTPATTTASPSTETP
jgi:UDP-3-O-[3-hydroxymyristoyl] glucosamine N-acyltransferase